MENEQVEWKMNKNLSTSSKCEASGVIGSFIGMGMVGFCFGIGFILAVKTVNNLEYFIEELNKQKIKWQKKIKCNENHNNK